MSDRETGGLPGSDEDLSLPKATVAKMITGTRLRFLRARRRSERSLYRIATP